MAFCHTASISHDSLETDRGIWHLSVEKEHITFFAIAPMLGSHQNRLLYSLTSRCAELAYHDVRMTGLSGCIRRPNAIASACQSRQLDVFVAGSIIGQRLDLHPHLAGCRASLDDDASASGLGFQESVAAFVRTSVRRGREISGSVFQEIAITLSRTGIRRRVPGLIPLLDGKLLSPASQGQVHTQWLQFQGWRL